MQTVQVSVKNGPNTYVPWFQNMNAQQALEGAYNQINNDQLFTYAIQYYGSSLGYLVMMINETYDSFITSAEPFFYWQFNVNGAPATTGIDSIILHPGDSIDFSFETYVSDIHQSTTMGKKHQFQMQASKQRDP